MAKKIKKKRGVIKKRSVREPGGHFGRTIVNYFEQGEFPELAARRLNLFDYDVTEWDVADLFNICRQEGLHRIGES